MSWAKIEIEFPPDTLDTNEVMQFLADHFKHPSGVPTATITLVSTGAEEPPEPPIAVSRPLLSGTAQSLGMSRRATWMGSSKHAPTSVTQAADELAIAMPRSKIAAIKEMRTHYGVGLKEAKDYIDEAWKRAGL